METINATAREQFVTDYCLVVDNDEESYRKHYRKTDRQGGKCLGVVGRFEK
jgi:hypothetical protein